MAGPLIIDLQTGNIGSVERMFRRIGAQPIVRTNPPQDLPEYAPIVLPGVGHFSMAARALDEGGWRHWLDDACSQGRAVLGICLGAQLMCDASAEGPGRGLGWIPTTVRRFESHDTQGALLRVPHMGWQPFTPPLQCLPFESPTGRMYYAHSFFMAPPTASEFAPYQFEYGGHRFASIVRRDRALGVQFHPEKSHAHGMAFLRAWLAWALAAS